MGLVKKLQSKLPQNWELSIGFFVFLIFALFMGDGKQMLVDVFAVIALISLTFFFIFKKRGEKKLPTSIHIAWIGLVIFYILQIFTSASAGYTITNTIRLLLGFVTFYLFYAYSEKNNLSFFILCMKIFTIFAATSSLIFFIIPHWAVIFPGMNLLFANFGHNHLAAIIIFTLPLFIDQFLTKTTKSHFGILLFILINLFLTFARGAYIVTIFYLLYVFVFDLKRKNKCTSISLAFILTTIALGFSLLITFPKFITQSQITFLPYLVTKQIFKPDSLPQSRLSYWQQAYAAFNDQPLFGHGPGTFYLLSKRYQTKPESYSYFAHNFPLETLAETGIIGFGFLFLLLFFVCKTVLKNSNYQLPTTNSQLFQGIILTFLYSCIDFNLNFLIIWLLLWAVLGLLLNDHISPTQSTTIKTPFLLKTSLLFLSFFYILSMASLIVSLRDNVFNKKLAFYLTPFDVQNTLQYLEAVNNNHAFLSPFELNLINFFHKKDPEIYFQLINLIPNSQTQQKIIKYETLLTLDSRNMSYYFKYVDFLLTIKSKSNFAESFLKAFISYSELFLPETFKLKIEEVLKVSPKINPNVTTWENFYKTTTSHREAEVYFSRAYYFLGLDFVDTNPQLTKLLWTLARDLNPSLSFYHIELASLDEFRLNNHVAAQNVLRSCLQYNPAKTHCAETLKNFTLNKYDLYPVGFFEEPIRNSTSY